MLTSLHKRGSSSDIMSPPTMSTSTARLINTSGNITMVGSTQTSVGRTSDDSLETTIEPRSIHGCLKGYVCSDVYLISVVRFHLTLKSMSWVKD